MTKHQPIQTAAPVTATPESILATYDQHLARACPHVPGGKPTKADLAGLRRRVATIFGISVEVVADAIARRTHAQRLAVAGAAARPRHRITRGIE